MSGRRVRAALEAAGALLAARPARAPALGAPPQRTLVMGDPQTRLERVLQILDEHGALGDDGWLASDVALVSMGDHFDWGSLKERDEVARDGEALLRWLAAQPEQVRILAGNHDLARVGELWGVSDEEFASAQRLADVAERTKAPADHAAFKAAHPRWFSAELVARDLCSFRASQRALVEELLRQGRLVAALALDGALYVHAGVTRHELDLLELGVRAAPEAIADALNARLRQESAALGERRLSLAGLHEPGNAEREGVGMFYHRPSLGTGEHAHRFAGDPPRRRFRPSALPPGLVQVVGHVRDEKCRKELADWCDLAPARDGPLRHLIVEGQGGRYAHGTPPAHPDDAAVMIFTDNGMDHVARPADYQLLDAHTRQPARRGR